MIIAHNVEKYIAQALDSVLMQQVSFDYEILVGENPSTDRTREILVGYARRHPDRIRLILRPENIGMNANFISTFFEARGEYIALLDGDDYWLSPDKLRKQVEFLDAHPECTVCFHNALVVYDDEREEPHAFNVETPDRRISARVPKSLSGVEEVIAGNFLQTGSVMYRAGTVRRLPEWFLSIFAFDWPLHVLHAERGAIGYIDELLSAYRVREGAFWSTGMSQYRTPADVDAVIHAYRTLNRHVGRRFTPIVRRQLIYLYIRGADVAMNTRQYSAVRRFAWGVVRLCFPHFDRKVRRALRMIGKSLILQLRGSLMLGSNATTGPVPH